MEVALTSKKLFNTLFLHLFFYSKKICVPFLKHFPNAGKILRALMQIILKFGFKNYGIFLVLTVLKRGPVLWTTSSTTTGCQKI